MSPSNPALSGTGERAFQGESRLRIVVFGLLVPVLVWAVNHAMFSFSRLVNDQLFLSYCYVIFVVEIGFIAWSVGQYMQHPVLRCVVFLWCIAFIDVMFVLFRFTVGQDLSTVGYAFASAQLGLLIAWSVLGTQSLGLRVFAALCGVTAVMLYVTALTTGFVLRPNFGRNDWDAILTWQAMATLSLCAALRWRRFRILPTGESGAEDNSSDSVQNSALHSAGKHTQTERVQFSILHVLMWTSALAPIFAVARLVDWTAIEIPTLARWMQFISLAVLFALTPLVAIWSGLGIGNVILRLFVPLVFTTSTGAILAYATNHGWLSRISIGIYTYRYRSGSQFDSELYVFWISWTVLAGFFYLALLLILRATDHRLIRVQKQAN